MIDTAPAPDALTQRYNRAVEAIKGAWLLLNIAGAFDTATRLRGGLAELLRSAQAAMSTGGPAAQAYVLPTLVDSLELMAADAEFTIRALATQEGS